MHFVWLNPDAPVFYLNEQFAAAWLTVLSGSHINPDSYLDRSLRRELYRVLDKTYNYLHDTLLISKYFAFLSRNDCVKFDVFAASL